MEELQPIFDCGGSTPLLYRFAPGAEGPQTTLKFGGKLTWAFASQSTTELPLALAQECSVRARWALMQLDLQTDDMDWNRRAGLHLEWWMFVPTPTSTAPPIHTSLEVVTTLSAWWKGRQLTFPLPQDDGVPRQPSAGLRAANLSDIEQVLDAAWRGLVRPCGERTTCLQLEKVYLGPNRARTVPCQRCTKLLRADGVTAQASALATPKASLTALFDAAAVTTPAAAGSGGTGLDATPGEAGAGAGAAAEAGAEERQDELHTLAHAAAQHADLCGSATYAEGDGHASLLLSATALGMVAQSAAVAAKHVKVVGVGTHRQAQATELTRSFSNDELVRRGLRAANRAIAIHRLFSEDWKLSSDRVAIGGRVGKDGRRAKLARQRPQVSRLPEMLAFQAEVAGNMGRVLLRLAKGERVKQIRTTFSAQVKARMAGLSSGGRGQYKSLRNLLPLPSPRNLVDFIRSNGDSLTELAGAPSHQALRLFRLACEREGIPPIGWLIFDELKLRRRVQTLNGRARGLASRAPFSARQDQGAAAAGAGADHVDSLAQDALADQALIFIMVSPIRPRVRVGIYFRALPKSYSGERLVLYFQEVRNAAREQRVVVAALVNDGSSQAWDMQQRLLTGPGAASIHNPFAGIIDLGGNARRKQLVDNNCVISGQGMVTFIIPDGPHTAKASARMIRKKEVSVLLGPFQTRGERRAAMIDVYGEEEAERLFQTMGDACAVVLEGGEQEGKTSYDDDDDDDDDDDEVPCDMAMAPAMAATAGGAADSQQFDDGTDFERTGRRLATWQHAVRFIADEISAERQRGCVGASAAERLGLTPDLLNPDRRMAPRPGAKVHIPRR